MKKKWELKNKIVILTLSRIHPKKGINFLIGALPKLLKNNNNYHLLIAGPFEKLWYKNKLKRKIKRLKLNNNITFTDSVYGKEKEEIFLLSDMFVIPSICEVVHATLLEAFHYKIPVISTHVGHSIDIIENGKNGFLVPKRNSKILANRIMTLTENKKLSNKFIQKGKIIADQRQWSKCAHMWIKVFNKFA